MTLNDAAASPEVASKHSDDEHDPHWDARPQVKRSAVGVQAWSCFSRMLCSFGSLTCLTLSLRTSLEAPCRISTRSELQASRADQAGTFCLLDAPDTSTDLTSWPAAAPQIARTWNPNVMPQSALILTWDRMLAGHTLNLDVAPLQQSKECSTCWKCRAQEATASSVLSCGSKSLQELFSVGIFQAGPYL